MGGRTGAVSTRRLFIAVPLSEASTDAVVALVDRVRGSDPPTSGPRVRWVRMDGLHLTLRFLGPTPEERVAAVAEAVRASAATIHPFEVRIAGAGWFPPRGRPRVLWLGIPTGERELGELAAAVSDRLAAAGWPSEERPFRAHLSLARCDGSPAGPATARKLAEEAVGFETAFMADRLMLFESHVGGGPARYEALLEIPLSG